MRSIDGSSAAVPMSALLWLLWCGDALATEGGGSVRALGVDTVMAGLMGPQGSSRLTGFLGYYDANKTLDSAGHARPGISDFGLEAGAAILRWTFVWPNVQLFGGDIETRVALPYAKVKIGFDAQTPAGSLRRQGTESGISDALLAPATLGWHSPRYHQMVGVYFYLPTGEYDPARLANPGRGYFAWAPVYWFTWFPIDGFEISGNATYVINSKNSDTQYTSGKEAGLDFGIGYDATQAWQVGVSGYLYKQVTNDKVNGQVAGDGRRGQVVGIGPFVRYHPYQDWGVTLKWQSESAVENRTQGNRFLLQFTYGLW